MVFKPEVLIISNPHDYSTDHVVFQLEKLNADYIRLNRSQFSEYELTLDPLDNAICGKTNWCEFEINQNTLKSIYYRAPIYLRTHIRKNLSFEEKIARDQWTSFLRSLMVFDNVAWINHPQSTFLAENKPYQLKIANEIGFNVPKTIISNKLPSKKFSEKVAIKTLEPAIFDMDDKQTFIYTNIYDFDELGEYDFSLAPMIIQEAIIPKIDIRVTIIGDNVYPISIKHADKGLDVDWRTKKEDLQYELIDLPEDVENKCLALLNRLDLNFGCIDMVNQNDDYYFIEINPTGEWDWLMYNLKLDVDVKIAKALLNDKTL